MDTKHAKGSTTTHTTPGNKEAETHITKHKGEATDLLLEEFFHDELKDIYWAEKHLVKTLPKMSKAAHGKELKKAFTEHLTVTNEHVNRLDKIFKLLGYQSESKKCEAMEGIIKEGDSIIDDTKEGTATRDAGLIMAGRKVEHYEIATYGALSHIAQTLGHTEIVKILQSTLTEEEQADDALTELAENTINKEAAEEQK